MTIYSKAQEKRMREVFKKNGFTIVENTANETQHRGDAVVEHDYTGITFCVDHKGTVNKEGRRIEKRQLEKIREEATNNEIPLLTVSFKGHKRIYAVIAVEDLDKIMN